MGRRVACLWSRLPGANPELQDEIASRKPNAIHGDSSRTPSMATAVARAPKAVKGVGRR